jgi:hypothetical protein
MCTTSLTLRGLLTIPPLARLGEELKLVLELCQVTEEEANGLWATGTWVCNLAVDTSFRGLSLASLNPSQSDWSRR